MKITIQKTDNQSNSFPDRVFIKELPAGNSIFDIHKMFAP